MRHPAAPETSKPARPQARQKRSARTQDKLLSAAVRVLNREGLDGATVPLIAAEAKLSPASIYRRFVDKDDLLRAAILRMLGDPAAATSSQTRASLVGKTLAESVEALVGSLLKQRNEHPQVLRALHRVLEAEPKSPFSAEALRRVSDDLNRKASLLLEHRDSIRHPEPERAVRFALLSAKSAIDMAGSAEASLWRTTLPLSDKAFAAELARQTIAYLRRKP